jgi:hypothetical protein
LGHDIQVQGAHGGVLLQAIADVATQDRVVSKQSHTKNDDEDKLQRDQTCND